MIAKSLSLADVPRLNIDEHPDLFLEALSIAASYGNEELKERFPMGVYAHLSGYTGRSWLIGFDNACYYWERHGIRNPHPAFAVSGLEANLEHYETMREAIAYLGYAPEFVCNTDCGCGVDAELAAPFLSIAEKADSPAIRRYVTEYLATRHRPLVCFLYSPGIPIVDAALLTGFESGGEVILGRSPYQDAPRGEPVEPGHFSLADWERQVVAVVGLGEEVPFTPERHPCYTAIENALRYSESSTRDNKYYGLSAYDAWECALLDEECIAGADDHVVSRRLLYHSSVAGNIACQKAFTAFPDYWDAVPSMGVISGLLQRVVAGPQIIHGLMWDVWQVVGGYWRGAKQGDAEYRVRWDNAGEVRRFRDRAVRERAVEVIRRARRTDEQAIVELRQAKADWDRCRGQGSAHPCPCFGEPCTRAWQR
jgi:hypothetical protein